MARANFSDLRHNLEAHLDRVETDRLELVVTRRGQEDMVILPRADFEAIQTFIGEADVGYDTESHSIES